MARATIPLMLRLALPLILIATIGAADNSSSTADKPLSMKELTFLSREGCVNTPDMAYQLETALKALGWPNDYQVVDIGELPKNDARTGYPTPTLLWKGRDIFGMPVPKPPYEEPT